MASFDELTPQEIEKAVALAVELQEKDRRQREAPPGNSARERLPFLAQAVRTLRATREQAAERRSRRDILALGGLVALLVILDVAFVLPRLAAPAAIAKASDSASPPPSALPADNTPLSVTLPPPDDTTLSGIPVPAGFKLNLRSYDSGIPTSITFINRLKQPINLEWIGKQGFEPYFRVKPGETFRAYMQFNQPVLVTDASRKALGLYYPAGFPTTAMIDGPSRVRRAADLRGYLRPARPEDFPAQVKTGSSQPPTSVSPTGISSVWVTFLNMRKEPVNLNEMNPNGSASFITKIAPGEMWTGHSQHNVRWIVMDTRQKAIGRYKSPPVDRAAVLLPD